MGNKLASNSPRLARIAPKGGGPNDALSRLRNRGHMVRLEPAFENRARRLVPACFDGGRLNQSCKSLANTGGIGPCFSQAGPIPI